MISKIEMPLKFSKVISVILISLREERRWKEQKLIFGFVGIFEKSILYIGLGEGKENPHHSDSDKEK